MRRLLVLLLTAAMLASGAAAVDAKPGRKSPRLHAFRSCTNLLGYAQRNGLRVIRQTPLLRPPPAPMPIPQTGGGDGGSGEGGGGVAPMPAPVAAPAPEGGEATSQTNVQEAGVDEPDWVKAAGTTLYVARDGKLRALDASGDRPRALGALDLPGFSHELLVRGDRALVIATLGSGAAPVASAGQVPGVPPSQWLGRTRLLEVDVSDPARMRVLRELDVEGSYLSARLTGATARVIVRTEPRGLALPASDAPRAGGAARRLAAVRAPHPHAGVAPVGRAARPPQGHGAPARARPLPPGPAHAGILGPRHADRPHDRHEARPAGGRRRRPDDRRRHGLRVAGPALRRLPALARAGRLARRDPRPVRHRPARVLDRAGGGDELPRQRRGAGLPAQPVVAVRARGDAARRDDLDAAVEQRCGCAQRERGRAR